MDIPEGRKRNPAAKIQVRHCPIQGGGWSVAVYAGEVGEQLLLDHRRYHLKKGAMDYVQAVENLLGVRPEGCDVVELKPRHQVMC